MTISLTQEIERIENMPVVDMTTTIHAHLERLKDLQSEQSLKGGPVKTHHEIKGRKT